MSFWWLSDEEKVRLDKANSEFFADLRERPLNILRSGVVSYEHHVKIIPMIQKMLFRYNGKDYVFHISKIEVKESEKRDNNDRDSNKPS